MKLIYIATPLDGSLSFDVLDYVAGDSLLAHSLDLLPLEKVDELLIVAGNNFKAIKATVAERYSNLDVGYVVVDEPVSLPSLIISVSDYVNDREPILLFIGGNIVKADWIADVGRGDGFIWAAATKKQVAGIVLHADEDGHIEHSLEAASVTGRRYLFAGVSYWRQFSSLAHASINAVSFAALISAALADKRMYLHVVDEWEEAATDAGRLRTNRRLLSVGYGTQSALERSFGEGFTVLPPVFIHATADIDASVIGPHATIGPAATVHDAIVRNSIVSSGAHVESCILDGSLLAPGSEVVGQPKVVQLDANQSLELK